VSLLRDLLLSLVGGGGIALLLFWLTNRRDKQYAREQRDEERKGLWRLVDMEIYQNRSNLLMMKESPDIGQLYESYSRLHTQVWDECNVRLAQLVRPEHTEVLGRYHLLLQRLGTTLQDDPYKSSTDLNRTQRRSSEGKTLANTQANAASKRDNLLSVYARDAVELGDEARKLGERYIGKAPDYFELYNDELDTED